MQINIKVLLTEMISSVFCLGGENKIPHSSVIYQEKAEWSENVKIT